jgi:hypothetical protein
MEMKTLDDLHDEDDDLNIGDNLPNGDKTDDNPNPDLKPEDKDKTDDKGNGDDDEPAAPGIEQFLSQYGISGGIITFEGENGTEPESKHYNDLTPEEQFNVLSDLVKSGIPSIEAKYGLNEEEIGLVNFVRGSGKSVNDAINELAQERLQQMLALKESFNTDYKNMSDEAIVSRWLKDNNPDATEDELAEELARSKDSRFFEKNAASVRETYIKKQEQDARNEQANLNAEQEALIENDRAIIANAAVEISHIAGFAINDEDKNEILGKILEVNQHGDSLFMEEVFSDPAKLIKAAWLFYNADNYLDQLDQKHKRDLANEYQKGRKHATNGFSPEPISGVDDKRQTSPNGQPEPIRTEKHMTLDDLHNDD